MSVPASQPRSRAPRPDARRLFIEESTLLPVRFNEVDALHIVWHGHYVNYFEEARRALGRRLGIDYPVFLEHNIGVPVIHLQLDFLAPARMADTLKVTARLFKPASARLDYGYEITRVGEAALLATGHTSQVLTAAGGELLLNFPAFLLDRVKDWEQLWSHP